MTRTDNAPPLIQLTLARLREFIREPAALFWVYGFPLAMALMLALAFQSQPAEKPVSADVPTGSAGDALAARLQAFTRIQVSRHDETEARSRIARGKTDLLVLPAAPAGVTFVLDPNRAESVAARDVVEGALLRAASPTPLPVAQVDMTEPGTRYIDFLIPGLIGMNIMGGGLFGVGMGLVDMRVRKLLKRFLATPMEKRDLLLSMMLSRLLFLVPEVGVLLAVGVFVLGVPVYGSPADFVLVVLVGAVAFAGLGMLLGSRAKTFETGAGLVNAALLPMWLLSGVFFSAARFPEWSQPFVQALPLTALNNALRGVMLDGVGVASLGRDLLTLAAWGVGGFAVALRIFRWR